ncbi:MAG: hypothetical protein ACTSV2_07890 [Candidatus Thorarchaeota archaeon]
MKMKSFFFLILVSFISITSPKVSANSDILLSEGGGPTINPTWTSRTSSSPTSFSNDSVLVGDHVIIQNTWSDAVPYEPSEDEIVSSSISLSSGFYYNTTGNFTDPQGADDWPVPLSGDNYHWETVVGINSGDNVSVELQSSADPSFDVYEWEDANADGKVQSDELVGTAFISVDDGGDGATESGLFIAPDVMNIAIRIFCWNYTWVQGANYTLTVDTILVVEKTENGKSVSLDTYEIGRNKTMSVTFTAWTVNGSVYTDTLYNVTFSNYFAPVVQLLSPLGVGYFEDTVNITWTCFDVNMDDEHFFDLFLSADGGVTFQLLAKGVTDTNYTWNSAAYPYRDNYVIMVCAYDNDTVSQLGDPDNMGYWPGLTDSVVSGFTSTGMPGVEPGPPNCNVYIDSHPDDSEYTEGSSGNEIVWKIKYYYGDHASYSIYIDDVIQQTGEISRYDNVTMAIDGLSLGAHNITLHIHADNDDFDTVLVTVVPFIPSNETYPFPWLLVQVLVGGVSMAIVFALFMIQSKSSKD